MANVVGLRNPDLGSWDLTRSKYPEVNSLPLMESPGPPLMILAAYLLFVLKLGPAFMRKREAFQLRGVLIAYNTIQVGVSIFLVQKCAAIFQEHGLAYSQCLMNDESSRQQILFAHWCYFAAKVSELLDTVFFVLRKKYNQVSFLHLYHHSIMMIGCWACLKYAPSDNVVFIGMANSFIHIILYSYYGLSAMGPNVAKYLFFKKYITTLQLIQFVSMFFQYLYSLKYSECPPSKGVALFFVMNIIFFFYLFYDFYKRSYKTKSKKAALEKSE